MFKFKLNFGSIFGGAVCAVAAGVILYLISNNSFPPRGIKFVAMAGIGGAALGNWIWSFATPSDPDESMWGQTTESEKEQKSA
jgi:hypothetical protein